MSNEELFREIVTGVALGGGVALIFVILVGGR